MAFVEDKQFKYPAEDECLVRRLGSGVIAAWSSLPEEARQRILDEAKAREFYIDYLGFKIEFEHRFNDNAPLFMGISRGDVYLFLSEHHGDGIPGTYVRIDVQGVEELQAELKQKKYKYMNPGLQDQEWGRRELVVYDAFGNRLIFSEELS